MEESLNTPKKENIEYKEGDLYQIPYEGSLGLLALGHVGLKLWREKRAVVNKQRKAEMELSKKNELENKKK